MNAIVRALLLFALWCLCCGTAHAVNDADMRVDTWRLDAPAVSATPLRIRAWLPPGYDTSKSRYPVLYLNDGQDAEAVGLHDTLYRMTHAGEIRPIIVIAIDMPQDRMAAYGFSDRAQSRSVIAHTRHGDVGANANAYAQWLTTQLIPTVDARYRTVARSDGRALLGWSLGAASAFDIGWQYPELFARIGAFSPSFWLSAESGDASRVQATRIAHAKVDASEAIPRPKLFVGVGNEEEKSDRDGDGLIDVLDDAQDLLQGWTSADGVEHKGLQQLGYDINYVHALHPDRRPVAWYLLDGGRHDQASWARMLPVFLRWAYAVHAPPLNATGRVEGWQDVASEHVSARNIDVWLPPGYARHSQRRYPVLYMHDGQNLFDPSLVFNHTDWDIDGTMTRLIAAGKVRPAIVVAIWNSPARFEEYMPQQAPQSDPVNSGVEIYPPMPRSELRSDAYLQFLVEELKPFIDAQYRTQPDRANTFVAGSSMGGLISLYAIARHPDTFGGAGAVSTHWPAGDGAMVGWFGAHLPSPQTHRIWMDHGTESLDAGYAPYQRRMDAAMLRGGYRKGRNWESRVYPGTDHSEMAWRARVGTILQFLLGPPRKAK